MNIKQAKQRFTEITGLPAKEKAVFPGIWQQKGKVEDWFKFAWDSGLAKEGVFNARCTNYWVSIVKYLEILREAE